MIILYPCHFRSSCHYHSAPYLSRITQLYSRRCHDFADFAKFPTEVHPFIFIVRLIESRLCLNIFQRGKVLEQETRHLRDRLLNKRMSNARSPDLFIKPLQDCRCIFNILLSFLPHVKYWTILARTQNILKCRSQHHSDM